MDENRFFILNRGELEKRLDPEYYHKERRFEIERLRSSDNDFTALKHVVRFKKIITSDVSIDLKYIGLEDIETNTGKYLNSSQKESFGTALMFGKGDILFPKLRPYLNKVYLSEFNGLCSTEFVILETKQVSPKFLAAFLSSSIIVNQTKHMMSGNTLPRLQTEDIENLIVPLCNRNKQERVERFYDEAYAIKQQKEQQAAELLTSIDAYLLNALGIQVPAPPPDAIQNRMFKTTWQKVTAKRFDSYYHKPYFKEFFDALSKGKYPIRNLSSLSTKITSGATPKAGGEDYTNPIEGIPFIRSGELNEFNQFNFSSMLYVKKEIHEGMLRSSQLKKNDILIAIVGATIGSVAVYEDERKANINQAIALVRPREDVMPEYIKSILLSGIGKILLDHTKRPVARANINLDEIGAIVIPVPNFKTQIEIVEKVWAIRQQSLQMMNEAQQNFNQTKKEIERLILE